MGELKDFGGGDKGMSEEERAAAQEDAANAALETKEEGLIPDPEVTVPTGDEENPVSGPVHDDAMKTIFDKARKNRKRMISREGEENTDVERMTAMVNEASGGVVPEDGTTIDTNRDSGEGSDVPDPFKADVREEREALLAKPESEVVNKDAGDALVSLTGADPEAKVTVKILGQEYNVPQQDIDDAGGMELYQKFRTANMRLQSIATLERALPAKPEPVPADGEQQDGDPSPDGLDEAEITTLREEVMDAMIDGDMDAVDAVLKKAQHTLRPAPEPKKPEASKTDSEVVHPAIQEARDELVRQFEEDRVEANNMMRREYADIMGDHELLQLAMGRFNLIRANPDNTGRTQKELARESAEYVRSVGKRLLVEKPTNPIEEERRKRIERKRALPPTSRADAPAVQPSKDTPKSTKESRRDYLAKLRRASGNG